MATDLTGLQVRNTYNSLLKIGDNTSLTGIAKRISDGLGNDSPLFISTSQISIGVAPATGYDLTVNSGIRTGSIDVLGAATAQSLQFTGGGGTQGTMSWNTDEETIDLIQNGATLQLGQETHVHVKNQSGATINDGTPVYVTGTLGASGRLTVAPMIADGSIEAKYFLGVTTENIPNGEDGKVTTFGKIRGLNTSAYAPGTTLYVSSTTAGFWQTTPPVSPALDLEVAIVINQHANNGTLFVRAQNGQYLGLLHDVYLNSVADNQLLVYNATNSRWENQGIASIGAINLDTVTDNGNTTTNSISVGDINAGNVTLTGYLRGAANFVIDPAAHGDDTGTVQILGNLRVDGTTTTINSTTVTIADKNIVLAEGSALPGDANGAGITIDGAAASMTYNSTSDRFVFNKDIETNLVGNVTGNLTGNVTGAASLNVLKAGDTMTGDLDFNDNVKAKFGTGDDLTVYHNATNSLIDNATGSILIRNLADDQDIVLVSDDGAGSITDYLRVDGSEGSVKLFHYGSEKLVTTATGVSVTGAFSGNLNTSSISGSTIDINGTTAINLQYNGSTQLRIDTFGVAYLGTVTFANDGISLTDEDSTTDSFFHANVDYDAGLYQVTSNARYGADYIQVDGLDSRSNTRFTISPKDIGDPDPFARLYIGGNNSNTAPNTLVDWHTIYMNALSVRINNNEVATQTWVTSNTDLQDVTDRGATTDNSISITGGSALNIFNSTNTNQRLTINQSSGTYPRIYNYDEGAATFHSIKIGGSNNETSGLIIEGDGVATFNQRVNAPSLHIGSAASLLDGTDPDISTGITYSTSKVVTPKLVFLNDAAGDDNYITHTDTNTAYSVNGQSMGAWYEFVGDKLAADTNNSAGIVASGLLTKQVQGVDGIFTGSLGVSTTATNADLDVQGTALIGSGANTRADLGLTLVTDSSNTFVANTDLTDTYRQFTIINDNDTVGAYSSMSFRVYPSTGTAMADIKLVRAGTSGDSTLYTTIKDNAGNFKDIIKTTPSDVVINGDLTITGDGGTIGTSGSIADAWLKIGTGLGFDDNQMLFEGAGYINATGALYISGGATGTGNNLTLLSNGLVGIGTDSPQTKLHLTGAITISDVGAGDNTTLIQFTESNNYDQFAIKGDFAGAGGENKLKFTTDLGGGDILTLKGDGNVGVGISSPLGKLDVRQSQQSTPFTTPFLKLYPTATTSLTGHTTITLGTSVVDNYGVSLSGWRYGTDGDPKFRIKMHNNSADGVDALTIDSAGKIGIGTTSPTQKLDVAGIGRFVNPSNSLVRVETSQSGSYRLDLYANYNYANPVSLEGYNGYVFLKTIDGGNAVALYTLNNPRLFINSSGNVGIGTTSPSFKLDINSGGGSGGLRLIGNSASYTGGFIANTGTGAASLYFDASNGDFSGGDYMVIRQLNSLRGEISMSANTPAFDISMADVPKFTVLQNGNVGIGTTSPATKLDVVGDIRSSTGISVKSGVSNLNSGIGATMAVLNDIYAYIDLSTQNGNGSWIDFSKGDGTDYRGRIRYWNDANRFAFYASGSSGETLTIIDNRVGINRTSPAAALDVGGDFVVRGINETLNGMGTAGNFTSCQIRMNTTNTVDTTGWQGISFDTSTAANYGWSIGANRSGSGRGSFRFYEHVNSDAGAERFTLQQDGNVGINDSTPSYKLDVNGTIRATSDIIAFSDARVKENVKTIDNALDKVTQLRGVSYNKIGETEEKIGVIAQEIEKVLPQVVQEDDEGMKSVAYGNIVGVLIESIKELKQEIDELKARLDA